MRGLLLLSLLALAMASRDAAFWERILYQLSPRANRAIVNEISVNMNKFVRDFDMSNDRRISHFLGQCAIESDHYKTTTEYASGAAYNGRRDLGNLQPGDGPRFKGRGLIQLTGRANYGTVGRLIGQDLISNPSIVATFPLALQVSGIYWRTRPIDGSRSRSLNDLADANDYTGVTRNINGRRMLALRERIALTQRAFTLLQQDRIPGAVVPVPTAPGSPPHLEVDMSFLWDDDTIILTNRNDVFELPNPNRGNVGLGTRPRVPAAAPAPPVRRILRGGRPARRRN